MRSVVSFRQRAQSLPLSISPKKKEIELEKMELISKLQDALDRIKLLRGIIPICSACKNIRDDQGYWNNIENYIKEHSDADFSHGICPDCARKLYPEFLNNMKGDE